MNHIPTKQSEINIHNEGSPSIERPENNFNLNNSLGKVSIRPGRSIRRKSMLPSRMGITKKIKDNGSESKIS